MPLIARAPGARLTTGKVGKETDNPELSQELTTREARTAAATRRGENRSQTAAGPPRDTFGQSVTPSAGTGFYLHLCSSGDSNPQPTDNSSWPRLRPERIIRGQPLTRATTPHPATGIGEDGQHDAREGPSAGNAACRASSRGPEGKRRPRLALPRVAPRSSPFRLRLLHHPAS